MTTALATETLEERGQQTARRFLSERGYNIIEKGWSFSQGSKGFVAEDGDALVFIQVISRESDDGKLPEEKAAKKSRASFESSAAKFLSQHNKPSMPVRFDIISLLFLNKTQALLRHHIDALSSDIE